MAISATQFTLCCVICIVLLARPTYAFGAGNIGSTSAVEGQNWRHGDIEDVLLTLASARAMSGKKFSKLDVKRVYFGNWLRDYSQAIDVGTTKYVSAKAITLLLWILGFMSFGYGTGEFEVTMDRLGCYRPEDHIDNPRNYADNEDARKYDRRLRGPVDERKELTIDPETGLKTYIASERLGITTSASHVRTLFGRCIELGRRYGHNKNKADLYEALRLLGTACHCLEDYPAHSNYTELALIEMGERHVFPHVGRDTQLRLRGARQPVYPIITGTFGGVDFLHSVTGEFDDKATQSEIQELENTMQQAQQNQGNTSLLESLLSKVPAGMFGDKNEAGKVEELKANSAAQQMQNVQISPREPEEWAGYLDNVQKQIYPIIQFHDEIMQGVTETVESIPILPDLLESLQDQLNIFVFSLIAPFILPVISQIKTELNTGSSKIIESSVAEQHIVFSDDRCTDPTHSMLSKDHFSNVLNEPAGKVAGQILRWVVPQIIAAWDDDSIDVDRTLNRIVSGVLHHPAMRDFGDDGAVDGRRLMFAVVEQWWNDKSDEEKDILRDQLSRDGVESGRNHKPGVVDHGHGSGKPLGMPKAFTANSSGAPGGGLGGLASTVIGGGALGAIVGGLTGGLGGNILGGNMNEGRETYNRTSYGDDGSRTQTVTQIGHSGEDRYGQALYSRTDEPYGGRTETYNRFEQTTTSSGWQSEVHREEQSNYGGYTEETRHYGGTFGEEGYQREEGYGQRRHGGGEDDSSSYMPGGFGGAQNPDDQFGRHHQERSDYNGGYSRRTEESEYSSFGRRDEDPSRGSDTYDRRQNEEEPSYGSNTYDRQRQEEKEPSYGRRRSGERQEQFGAYGEREDNNYGGRFGGGYEQRNENEYESRGQVRQEGDGFGSRRYGEGDGDEGEYRRRSRSGSRRSGEYAEESSW